MEEPVSLSLRGLRWHYKGEGNSNLVISLSDLKMIVRLYKSEDGCCKKKVDYGKANREVLFWRRILIPHFGSHLKAPILAFLSENDALDINRVLRVHRPKQRLNKSIRSGLVTIYPDYTFLSSNNLFYNSSNCGVSLLKPNSLTEGSTFCVEIKPKQGWTHMLDRQRKCTFCLNQFLKLQDGRVASLSSYCPLDLFSGNKIRMKHALRSLLRNPQNNLKIFLDGHIIFSESSNSHYEEVLRRWFKCDKVENIERIVEKWTDLVYSALTTELSSKMSDSLLNSSHLSSSNEPDYNSSPSIFSTLSPCDWSLEQLPKDCVLNRILLFQKLQDTDFKTVYRLYKQIEPYADNYQYVSTLLEEGTLSLGPIERYLLAATAKDCSISIAFFQGSLPEKSNDEACFVCEVSGVTYRTSIGLLDLDPKPLSCIAKHYNRDLGVHSAYLSTFQRN